MTRLPALGLALILSSTAAEAQDAAAGEKEFRRCKACHMIGEDAKNRVGPVLTGVVGRTAGTHEGFRYGDSMRAAGEAGLVWDEETLFDYLAGPTPFLQAYLDDPGAKGRMAFSLDDEQTRRDVIAYLATFSADRADAGPGDGTTRAGSQVCVTNASDHAHLFAVETPDEPHRTATLAPGETLCAGITDMDATGTVSVFERPDEQEGCSRIVPAGHTEEMRRYVDFDRCFWSSNS